MRQGVIFSVIYDINDFLEAGTVFWRLYAKLMDTIPELVDMIILCASQYRFPLCATGIAEKKKMSFLCQIFLKCSQNSYHCHNSLFYRILLTIIPQISNI